MRSDFLIILFLLIAVMAVLLLVSTGQQPLLYTITNEPRETQFHTDIRVISAISVNSSADLLPVMQDLLDISGTIAITIRKNDLETAGQDLARYQKRYQDLNNIILKLDMNQSEVADFSKNSRQQNDILRQFVNSSESLQSLKKLEVQYHEDNDPTSLTTVKLQGKALERKLRTLRSEYETITDIMTGQAESKGLDSQGVRKGKEAIGTFTQEVAADQDVRERQYADSELTSSAISILVEPDIAEYRELIDIFGFISGNRISSRPIWIVIDGNPVAQVKTDDTGQYRTSYEIRNIAGGNHSVSTYWDGTRSESRTINVPMGNTTLSLGYRVVKNQAIVNLSGVLSARQPVQQAPVRVLVNNETWNTTITDESGRYFTSIALPAGTYSLNTVFDNSSFPLNSSMSSGFDITSTGRSISSIVKSREQSPAYRWIILLLIPCFGGVAWWYIRRNRGSWRMNRIPGDRSREASGNDLSKEQKHSDELSLDSLLAEKSGSHTHYTISDAAYLMYGRLLSRLLSDLPVSHIRTVTPRELTSLLSDHPRAEFIMVFVWLYERVRYGGSDTEEEFEELRLAMNDIEQNLAGDRDED